MKKVSKPRILIVDDEETMRQSLGDILRLDGYVVQTAANGSSAVETLQRNPPDLMILDLKMPGMDGLEVLRLKSQIAPETMVILLTAHGSLESAIEAIRQDAFDYLLKPASPQQILSSVSRALAYQIELKQEQILKDHILSTRKAITASKESAARSVEHSILSLTRGVRFDFARREVHGLSVHGAETIVKLTPAEGKLLRVLLENQNQVLAHRDLVQRVQGYEVADWEAPEVVRPLVSRLRRKLSIFPSGENWITNVRGSGYIFSLD